jgi:hypothetical protein
LAKILYTIPKTTLETKTAHAAPTPLKLKMFGFGRINSNEKKTMRFRRLSNAANLKNPIPVRMFPYGIFITIRNIAKLMIVIMGIEERYCWPKSSLIITSEYIERNITPGIINTKLNLSNFAILSLMKNKSPLEAAWEK